MIRARSEFHSADVAAHYDELDRFYREIWGEHIHHGLWQSKRETVDDATRRLIAVVADQAQLKPGDRVCDVGCGYGGTARALAGDYGAQVTALTVSQAQHAHAAARDPAATNPTYLLRDWLENGLEPASFDAVIAIESSEHMTDLGAGPMPKSGDGIAEKRYRAASWTTSKGISFSARMGRNHGGSYGEQEGKSVAWNRTGADRD